MSDPFAPPRSEIEAAAYELGRSLPATPPADPAARHQEIRRSFERVGEFGLMSMAIPRRFGGLESSAVDILHALEGLGEGCPNDGLLFSLGAHMWAVMHPLVVFGTDQQGDRYLPKLTAGTWIGAHAATEAESGSHVMGMATRYVDSDGKIALDGIKHFVTNAPVADVFLAFATRDSSLGFMGVSGFIVEKTDPGILVGADVARMGLDGSSLSTVTFDGSRCIIPNDRLLGPRNGGAQIFREAMLRERLFILGPQIGAMKRALRRCIEHAQTRRQNGVAIGKHQMVSSRIVEMYSRWLTSRALAREAAALLDAGQLTAARAAVTKLALSEAAIQQHLDAMRIHGASGYMSETGIEAELRGAMAGVIYSGTSEMQRLIIASEIGL